MPYSTLSRHASSLGLWAAAGLAGMLALAPRASAADLDPGYADVPPPMTQQQLQFGSGWYVRGDIAATDRTYRAVNGHAPGSDSIGFAIVPSKDAGYSLSLGGGYSFTNNFRADITADFIQPSETVTHNVPCQTRTAINGQLAQNCTLEGNLNRYDALVNGYYDIGTWSIFTPYVGAGAGLAFGNINNKLYDDQTYSGRASYHVFAWAAMAGVAVDIYPHVKLDVGYRYLDGGKVYGANLYNHQVRAGIRYMIDN